MTTRTALWLTLGLAVVGVAGGGWWYVAHEPAAEAAPTTSGPVATAEVTLSSLAATETWGGTLGHGSATTVAAVGGGTITRLAAQDTAVDRGTTLYRVDEQPVTLLFGAIPMYRDLAPGDTGVDVEQLEANLAALGYTGFTADDEYTWYTEAAVREWQADAGAAETGVVGPSSVVFLPAGGQVEALHAGVGDTVAPGSPVLDVTGTEQVVSLEADVADRDLLAIDTAVTVQLPGGTETTGVVTAASVAQTTTEAASGTAGAAASDTTAAGADDAVVTVEVTLAEPADADLLGSPVDVVVPVDERTDVLVVPVNALLALTEGGYGLEVVADDGSTSIVGVDTGLFADGKVEVSGTGIAPGTVVGVAGR